MPVDPSDAHPHRKSQHAIGRVAAIWRYPVKSMAGEQLEAVEVSWHGLVGDRRWAFIRPDRQHSGFPWLTIRENPRLWHYRPVFADARRADASRTDVIAPSGDHLEVVDPRLAAELGTGVRALRQDRGIFDDMPLSLLTNQSVASVRTLTGQEIDARRFRPNIVIDDTDGEVAYPEDAWVGSTLQIGTLGLRVDQRDPRCAIINVDPDTAEHDRATLRAVARERDNRLGVYGSITQPGRIAVGDDVFLT